MLLLENVGFEKMNEAFELIDQLSRQNNNESDDAFDALQSIFAKMSKANRTEMARKIIETSRLAPYLLESVSRRASCALSNEILKTSFYYRDFEMAKVLIQSGASLQSVLLQSGDSEIKSIGAAIYQMHKYRTVETDVITFFLDNVIGSSTKSEIKEAIDGEAALFNDDSSTCPSSSGGFRSPKVRRRISICETLPELNKPKKQARIIEVLNKTNTITQERLSMPVLFC